MYKFNSDIKLYDLITNINNNPNSKCYLMEVSSNVILKKTKDEIKTFFFDFFKDENNFNGEIYTKDGWSYYECCRGYSCIEINKFFRNKYHADIRQKSLNLLINCVSKESNIYFSLSKQEIKTIYKQSITKGKVNQFLSSFVKSLGENKNIYSSDEIKKGFSREFNADISERYIIESLNKTSKNHLYLQNSEYPKKIFKKDKREIIYRFLLKLFEKDGASGKNVYNFNIVIKEFSKKYKADIEIVDVIQSINTRLYSGIYLEEKNSVIFLIHMKTIPKNEIKEMYKFFTNFFESDIYSFDEIRKKFRVLYSVILDENYLNRIIKIINDDPNSDFYLIYQSSRSILKISKVEMNNFLKMYFDNVRPDVDNLFSVEEIEKPFNTKYNTEITIDDLRSVISNLNKNPNSIFILTEQMQGKFYKKTVLEKEINSFLEESFCKVNRENNMYSVDVIKKDFRDKYNAYLDEKDVESFLNKNQNRIFIFTDQMNGKYYKKTLSKKEINNFLKEYFDSVSLKENNSFSFDEINKSFRKDFNANLEESDLKTFMADLNNNPFNRLYLIEQISEKRYIKKSFQNKDIRFKGSVISKLLREIFLEEKVGVSYTISEFQEIVKKKYESEIEINEFALTKAVSEANNSLLDIKIYYSDKGIIQSGLVYDKREIAEKRCPFCNKKVNQIEMTIHVLQEHTTSNNYCSILQRIKSTNGAIETNFRCYHCKQELSFNEGSPLTAILHHINGYCLNKKSKMIKSKSEVNENTNRVYIGTSYSDNSSVLGNSHQIYREHGKFGSYPSEDYYGDSDGVC